MTDGFEERIISPHTLNKAKPTLQKMFALHMLEDMEKQRGCADQCVLKQRA